MTQVESEMTDEPEKSAASTMRMERIERLLRELEYEVTRGMLNHEVDETLAFRFMVPISRAIEGGIVFAEFRTRPIPRYEAVQSGYEPAKLKVIK
jgi:hypothetical protein